MNDHLLLIKLNRAIQRSEIAYSYYIKYKKYYLALRIKNANNHVYNLLEEYLFISPENETNEIINYLFHLEDWFLQFENLEKSIHSLDQEFIFPRLQNSPSFPENFIQKLKDKIS